MPNPDNIKIVLDYIDALNRGDFDAMAGLFAKDALIHGVKGWGGLDVALPVWRELHSGLGMRLTVEGMVAEGQVVVARFTEMGRWVAPFLGHDRPTGQAYEITAMEWFNLSEGRIIRRWGVRDSAAQARQIGLAA